MNTEHGDVDASNEHSDKSVEDEKSQTVEETAEKEKPLTKSQKILARLQFLSLCWTLFVAGWNDGTIGPLLPRIQEVYHVSSVKLRHVVSWRY